jgi:hypothetical protein
MVRAANLVLDRSRVTGSKSLSGRPLRLLARAAGEIDRYVFNAIAIMQESI